MNKIKSSVIFPLCWKKTRRGKNFKFCTMGKNESCAEFTPLQLDAIVLFLWHQVAIFINIIKMKVNAILPESSQFQITGLKNIKRIFM